MFSTVMRRGAVLGATLALIAAVLLPASAPATPKFKLVLLFSCNVNPTIAGTAGNDTGNSMLQGTAANDTIRGYAGIDSANGKGGNDFICGDEGADNGLYGGLGNDIIRGGPGNDHAVTGNEGDDWIFGDDGNDILGAHPGKDLVFGGNDNDTLYGDTYGVDGLADQDTLNGGPGWDTCYAGWEDVVKNCEVVHQESEPPA